MSEETECYNLLEFNDDTDNKHDSDDRGYSELASDTVNKCSCCGFAPDWCQVFNSTQWSLFFLGLAAFIQGTIVNGMIHFFITTIERRYEMPSYQSGLMSGAFDMASMIFLIPVTYLGGRVTAHKPRWIATGTLIIAIGSFIYSSPHFIAGKYKATHLLDICIESDKEPVISDFDIKKWFFFSYELRDKTSSFSSYFWIFFFANFLHGVGGTPLFTLCIAYIDESVPREKSSLYLGVYYFMALLGPSIGYGLGGLFVLIYVDFLNVDASDLEICPKTSTWIGCWWIGFIICGFLALIISAIIFCMPKELKGSIKLKKNRNKNKPVPYQTLAELPKAFRTLLSNTVYMCVVGVACSEGLLVSGFGAFMPKILEKEFNLGSQTVAIVMGLVALPSALLGLVIGGWLVNYFNLGLKATIKLDIVLFILSIFCIPALLIGCPNEILVGITRPYFDNSSSQKYSLENSCNEKCHCSPGVYNPVCGRDNLQYFSACYAGCKNSEINVNTKSKVYFNCSCVSLPSEYDIPVDHEPEAISTPCSTDCPLFPVFLVLFFLYQMFTFTAAVPAISIILRVVNKNLKALALGLQWILSRLLGTIPGPVLYGAIMDHNCIYWYSPHGISKGVCLLYHHYMFRLEITLVAFIWKTVQVLFFVLALHFLKRYPPSLDSDSEDDVNSLD